MKHQRVQLQLELTEPGGVGCPDWVIALRFPAHPYHKFVVGCCHWGNRCTQTTP